ncbi:MAG: Cys-Gln thioester bond-forming surface protein [Clostridioides sp.]|jgi:LPXTG-motif cell wall-anchored protein|nr:Cys-Gln thioester bond-forming surface protein [Clostridioides sp.]
MNKKSRISRIKKSVSVFLSIVMTLVVYSNTPMSKVLADDSNVHRVIYPRPADKDPEWAGNQEWAGLMGHEQLAFLNGWNINKEDGFWTNAIGSPNGPAAYCIEPGVPISGENQAELSQKDETYWDTYPTKYNDILTPKQIEQQIGRILYYGYHANNSDTWKPDNEEDMDKLGNEIATQLLIWEVQVGERDLNFMERSASSQGKASVLDAVNYASPMKQKIISNYGVIVKGVKEHLMLPSFMANSEESAKVLEMSKDKNGGYSYTFNDTNNIAEQFDFSVNNGATCEISGNSIKIHSDKAPIKPIVLTAKKRNSVRYGTRVWSDGEIKTKSLQDVVTYSQKTMPDKVLGYAKVGVKAKEEDKTLGALKIVKSSYDKKIEGFTFGVSGPNGYKKYFKTNSNGIISLSNLPIGDYTISEIQDDTSKKYTLPKDKTVTLKAGVVTTVEMYNDKPKTTSNSSNSNKKNTTSKTAPKTGESRSLYAMYIIAGVSAVFLGIGGYLGLKNKRHN